MQKPITVILSDISNGKYTDLELQSLVQFIANELGLKTTSNYAKRNNKSFNGVKKCVPHIKIDNVKFHSDKLKTINLPF